MVELLGIIKGGVVVRDGIYQPGNTRDYQAFLSDDQLSAMEDDWLGWYRINVKNGHYFRHGGLLTSGRNSNPLIQVNTFYASFTLDGDSLNTHVVFFVNSPLPQRMAPFTMVEDAYNAAWESQ